MIFQEFDKRMNMSRELLSKYRTKIIEDFIMVEGYVTAIICKHYFGHLNKNFMREVLFDDLCSSGLKANLFEKALMRKRGYPLVSRNGMLVVCKKKFAIRYLASIARVH